MKGGAACIAFALLISPAAHAQSLTGVASVIDGDTIEIHGQRVRLAGIDAPESSQLCNDSAGKAYRCGQHAALELDNLIRRRPVSCKGSQHDRYKRLIATCWIDGLDINGWIVSVGWAVAYRKYSTAYVKQEEQARKAGIGLWAGRFDMPWDWRMQQRMVQ